MPPPHIVHGEIKFPPDATPFTPDHVLVELEDISRADAPSQVVARRKIITKEIHGGDVISFTLEVPATAVNEHHLYSVRVHMDATGSEMVERGDYITMQSYPVLTRGYGDSVQLEVRRV